MRMIWSYILSVVCACTGSFTYVAAQPLPAPQNSVQRLDDAYTLMGLGATAVGITYAGIHSARRGISIPRALIRFAAPVNIISAVCLRMCYAYDTKEYALSARTNVFRTRPERYMTTGMRLMGEYAQHVPNQFSDMTCKYE